MRVARYKIASDPYGSFLLAALFYRDSTFDVVCRRAFSATLSLANLATVMGLTFSSGAALNLEAGTRAERWRVLRLRTNPETETRVRKSR